MKTSQAIKNPIVKYLCQAVIVFFAAATSVQAAVTNINQTPMGTAAAVSAKPNVMVMLDDSGSMDWDYLPDNAKNFSGNFGFNSSHCNGVYYDPAITYTIPLDSTGIPLNNSAQTSFSAAYVDGYNTASGTVNLNTGFTGGSGSGQSSAPGYLGPAFYYTYTGTQTAGWQMNYYPSTTGTYSTFYTECQNGTVSGSSPSAPTGTQPFTDTVMGSLPPNNTITISGPTASITVGNSTNNSNTIGHVYVGAAGNNIQIWGSTATAPASNGSSKSKNTVASNIARGINACTTALVSPCTVTGYTATCTGYPNCTGSTVTISGPNSVAGLLPSVSNASGSITYSYSSFPSITATIISSIRVGGVELLSSSTASAQSPSSFAQAINSAINTFASPGFSSTVSGNKVSVTGPSSASGATMVITYASGLTTPPNAGLTATPSRFSNLSATADLQNFANWYSYYSHRMLMMKSGLGLAFSSITDSYRIGFMTMNNNVSPDFVDILPFAGNTVAVPCAAGSGNCQKDKWYTKLYGSTPGSTTPLREALSHVGQLYAHKFGTVTAYTATITVGGSGNTGATSVIVNGVETLNCAFINVTCPTGSTNNTVAQNIASEINGMLVTNYGATATGNVVTITGIAGSVGYTPIVTDDGGGMTFTTTVFASHTGASASLNGVTPLDPMEYSCQQNFVILSTDGFWNGANTYDLSNNAVGQMDGNEPRPMNDGGSASTQSTTQIFQSTQQITQLQERDDYLQTGPATLQWTTNQQNAIGALQWQTKKQQTKAPLNWQTKQQVTSSTLTWSTLQQTQTGYLQMKSGASWINVVSSTCTGKTTSCRLNNTNSTTTLTTPPTTYLGYGQSCVPTFTSTAGASATDTADSSGRATACPVSGSYSTATNLTAGQTCSGAGSVRCGTTGSSTAYAAYPGTCAQTYNGTAGTSTADASTGKVVTCPTSGTWSTAAPIGNSQTCIGSATINCPIGSTSTSYLSSSSAGCSTSWTAANATSTSDASGNVVTACPISGAWSSAAAVGANGICSGGTNVQCSNAGTATYVGTYPPACNNTFNGAAGSSTADASGNVTTCTTAGTWNPTWTNTAGGGSCTAGTNVLCQYNVPSWTTVTTGNTCTPTLSSGAGAWNITSGTACQYLIGSFLPAAGGTCTAQAASTTPPYSVIKAVTCNTILGASCTPGVTPGCGTNQTGPTAVASCNQAAAGAGNSYTSTSCSTVTTGPTPLLGCVDSAASSSNNYTQTTCTVGAGGTPDTLADVAEYYYVNDLRDNSLGNCTGALGVDVCLDNVPKSDLDKQNKQHMTTFTLGLGARGSMVFSKTYQSLTSACTPLTDGDFCSVLIGATAAASATPATAPATCSWQSAGTTCNWPVPSSGSIKNIDDLWHAAVNGRGAYFSATNPATLAEGLSSTLLSIDKHLGSSASATTSNPNISASDNFVFSSSFLPVDWTGEVIRESINTTTGAINCTGTPVCVPTIDWSAQTLLDILAATTPAGGSRNIYTYNPSATTFSSDSAIYGGTLNSGKLKSFLWANLTPTEQAYYNNVSGLTQYTSLTPAQQTAAAGANLVSYLRGDTSYYGTLYRARKHILGDIVDSKAVYEGLPVYTYGDTNYSAFAALPGIKSRPGMVYVGANDGMLHAFSAGGATATAGEGNEAWAYIPNLVEPSLYLLADTNYSTHHYFYVDGSPVSGDICPNAPATACAASQWKTILVGGLNAGGTGYYALDVTDPTQPKALWEFTDPNMGYSYGNPQITKLADGTWVVLLTSGYNNVPPLKTNGDGLGHLYVLNANSGALIRDISTGAGSQGTPSGLARISAAVKNPASDNTTQAVYGGDLLGNLWRFDINDNVGSSQTTYEAQLITTLKDASGVVQPITVKPEVGIVSNFVVIFVDTGQFLGVSDLSSNQVQTMYAIKDPMSVSASVTPSTPVYANGPRAATCASVSGTSCFVQQTATITTCPTGSPASICTGSAPVMTGTSTAVSFSTQSGWFIDFPNNGERGNTDPVLALGTLGFTTNTPSTANSCSVGGFSYNWFLNYANGSPVSTSTTGIISTELGTHNADGTMASTAFATSPTYFTLPDGTVKALTCLSDGTCVESTPPIGSGGGSTRRTSWRELILQ
jgi:Tfp pilus tip-associated adhesin PilY1